MSEEKSIHEMTDAKVSYENLERIKAIGKKGKAFNDVVTKLLDYYEDLQRKDWVNTQNYGNQYKDQIKNIKQFYTV
jgi:hypothetical protein